MIVVFEKQIHCGFSGRSSGDIWLDRTLDLPFVPFVGLEIIDGDWCDVVGSICWDAKAARLFAETESEKEIYEAKRGNINHRPLKEIVEEYLEEGWTIAERSSAKWAKLSS